MFSPHVFHNILNEDMKKKGTYIKGKRNNNILSNNQPFVRSIFRSNGKAPCIIPYTDEQLSVNT